MASLTAASWSQAPPAEATVYVLAALGVALVCLLVSLVPARRAATLDPVITLRQE